MKICKKCKAEKSKKEFNRSKPYKDGLDYICKPCSNKECSLWREKNPQKSLMSVISWQNKNPKKTKGLRLGYYWPELSPDKRVDKYNEMVLNQNSNFVRGLLCNKVLVSLKIPD